MKVKIIASGSKGNCILIIAGDHSILIDIGISTLKLKKEMSKEDLDISNLDGVLISHSHSDHTSGLKSLIKKYKTKVFLTKEVYMDISELLMFNECELVENQCTFGDLIVDIIKTSHDVPSNGYVVTYHDKSIVYITDTGYINKKYYPILENKDVYIIESNYNEQMLLNGPYPFQLKQRIISDTGHMSNEYTGRILSKLIGPKTKKVILAHISENNNTYDLAYTEVKKYTDTVSFESNKLSVAKQDEASDLIEV